MKIEFNTLRLISDGRRTFMEVDGKPCGDRITELSFTHISGRATLEVELSTGTVDMIECQPEKQYSIEDKWEEIKAYGEDS